MMIPRQEVVSKLGLCFPGHFQILKGYQESPLQKEQPQSYPTDQNLWTKDHTVYQGLIHLCLKYQIVHIL